MLKDSWKCISSMRMHLKAFPSVEEDINKGKTFIVSPLPLTLPSHKFPLLIDIKQNAVFGIRFLAAAQTNRKREGGGGGAGEVGRSVLRYYSAQPIRFPPDDVSQEQLARQPLRPRLFKRVEVGYFLASHSFVFLHL